MKKFIFIKIRSRAVIKVPKGCLYILFCMKDALFAYYFTDTGKRESILPKIYNAVVTFSNSKLIEYISIDLKRTFCQFRPC